MFWKHRALCVAGTWRLVAEHSLMRQFGTGRPDQQDEKELLNLPQRSCKATKRKGHLNSLETDHIENMVEFPQTRCKWKMHFLRSVRKRMPGGCYSLEQSEADR